jgi:DNA repair protein RadA/Sms
MAKSKTVYVCSKCGAEHAKWQGQCSDCEAWDTLVEQIRSPEAPASAKPSMTRHAQWAGGNANGRSMTLGEVGKGQMAPRLDTKISELNRVLGGGLVVGSVVLLGGEPGIGKSTLLLQAIAALSENHRTLYVTGEESLSQVSDRAKRLGLNPDNILAMAESEISAIRERLEIEKPQVMVADSIQTLYSEVLNSAPGSVSQVRECAATLTRYAKQSGCAIFLVGHLTKEGGLAGPKTLEHMVDAILNFEGEQESLFRIIRAQKNRFGATNEIGAFEMTEEGLKSVDNPSAMFLSEDRVPAEGSCVFVLQDGPRPLLIEIQALLDDCQGNVPRRLAIGVDANRMAMLLAVLHKHGNMELGDQDVFVNAVGGVMAKETAADLPMLLSMVSSWKSRAMPSDVACFGEIGLTGEVRPVQNADQRLREAAKLGFKVAIVPKRGLPKKFPEGLRVIPVASVAEAVVVAAEMFLPQRYVAPRHPTPDGQKKVTTRR